MKKRAKQLVSLLLVLCMCVAMLPQMLLVTNAVTPGYTPSSAYRSSKYYSNLLDVELTGNQRDDIINVALSQAGYNEGSYSGDYGGADDGVYDNYTEYNYWYNNYISSDMPVGGSWAPWCATFVSWCAEQAKIPTSILKRSTAAGHGSWCFNVKFYSGSSTLNSSSDNDSYFMGYNYTPKKGDLFFTRTWSHVGLVVSADGSYVTTVEGNTNSGGSAEGEGVFVRTRRIADLYFGVPDYEENYTSSCTYYPAHCEITIDSDTPINSQPCSVSTQYDSVNLGTAVAGQTYTATGLYLNGYGNYWYSVETDYGESSYLYAGDTTYVKQIISDITLTNYDAPSAHLNGSTFVVSGTIESEYNQLDSAACYIYSGFDQGGSAVTGYSDSVGGKKYVLDDSTVDYNTSFGSLGNGTYTYEISTTYTNYYATSNTSISSNSGTIQLLSEYFVVIPSSVDQSTCSHSNTTTTIKAATCTASGTSVTSCSKCGLVTENTVSASGHSYGAWTTVNATCTTDGSKTRTCSVCKNVETQNIAATGHKYNSTSYDANCQDYKHVEYICGTCGHSYKDYDDAIMTAWQTTKPNVDESLIETKTQYRYSDYETTTSYETSLAGYTQISSKWEQSGTGAVEYVKDWSSGFSTGNSLYTKYNKASSKKNASETETDKITINSDAITGYLYFHWCYADSYYSAENQSGSYTTFHAYYDTTSPDSFTCDTSDMSYKTSHSTCSNSEWFFVDEVYTQKYTTYKKLFTYEHWTDYSVWSDTAVTPSDTRKVETRTLYRYAAGEFGDHNYVNGTCTICGDKQAVKDYYLFGYINGADYGCEGDHANMGEYKFVNGKVTVNFAQDSYIGVKAADNAAWYMTKSYVSGKSATLYNTSTGASEKMLIPGGAQVTITMVVNADDTISLSYVINSCSHANHDTNGVCTVCGVAVEHTYINGTCSCGAKEPVVAVDYYLFGFINGADYACEGDFANTGVYKFVNGKLVATFNQDSYVGVKTGDNNNWYMTDGWQGTETTSATLYNTANLGNADKLYVPGGVEVTFTLVENGDGTLTLSYVTKSEPVVQPTLTLKYPTVSFEDEIIMNIFFSAEDLGNITPDKMGLITFTSNVANGTIENADAVIPGAELNSATGFYCANTQGIAAKNLGDKVYFRAYVQLADGSYVYSNMANYSPMKYGYTVLNGNYGDDMKALVAAMLNYGAAAQVYFNHNTDALVNADMTDAHKALVKAYSSGMIASVVKADSTKSTNFVNNGGFSRRYPSISFESAFCINYFFAPAYTVSGNITLYYWTSADYNKVSKLTTANATGIVVATSGAEYEAAVKGIAAKDLDSTIYVAAVYKSGSTTYCSGVLAYSIGAYCLDRITNGSANMQTFAAATAVYGYYAKAYFFK